MEAPVLSVRDLSLGYRSGKRDVIEVLNTVSLDLHPGRLIGLIGESGSGKSTLARTALGWRAPNTIVCRGSVEFGGRDLLRLPKRELRRLWGSQLAYVPQEVASALNPTRRVYALLDEVLKLHAQMATEKRRERITALLERVGIDATRESLQRYPFEFSGGQQQRIALVLAVLCEPKVVILDEPTTGIDASLRREVFEAIRTLVSDRTTAVLYISHDLSETGALADDLAVMYAGEIIEYGTARDVYWRPGHPYAAALRAAVPGLKDDRMVVGIPGSPPGHTIRGSCSFSGRCSFVTDICRSQPVPLVEVVPGRRVRCLYAGKIDPAGELRLGDLLVQKESLDVAMRLEVDHVTCVYRVPRGGTRVAVDGVSFGLHAGEILGIVGESGSGKSTLLRAIAGLHPLAAGWLRLDGTQLSPSGRARSLPEHRRIQLVFQSPERSLNPRRSVRQILSAPLRLYEPRIADAARMTRIRELLELVQLPSALLTRFPHELSGGEKQRVALARAFAARPSVMLCDEVVSALDVSVQATVMNLIKLYSEETGAAVVFVTHDLGVVRMMSERILVMRDGVVCEEGDTHQVFGAPKHPYTLELLAALPSESEGAPPARARGVRTR